MKNWRKKVAGVTLLEILAVISIIATISVFAMPLLSRFTKSAKLRSSSRRLANMLHLAKALAVTNNTPARLRVYCEGSETADNVIIEYEETYGSDTWLQYGKVWAVPFNLNIYGRDSSNTDDLTAEFTPKGTVTFYIGNPASSYAAATSYPDITFHMENRLETINYASTSPAERVKAYTLDLDPASGHVSIYSYGWKTPWTNNKM